MTRLYVGTGRVGTDRVGGFIVVAEEEGDLEMVLVDRLTTYADLLSLISTRVYPMILPQKPTLPAVTYQRIDGPREHGMTEEQDMAHLRIQIDSWAETKADAKGVAAEIMNALERWTDTATSPVILDSFLDNDESSYEPDTNIHRIRQDWIIWHRE